MFDSHKLKVNIINQDAHEKENNEVDFFDFDDD
jgi:hypothetical protein